MQSLLFGCALEKLFSYNDSEATNLLHVPLTSTSAPSHVRKPNWIFSPFSLSFFDSDTYTHRLHSMEWKVSLGLLLLAQSQCLCTITQSMAEDHLHSESQPLEMVSSTIVIISLL